MYIIVGLGNPEKKYDGTRHNIGFRMIDELADRYGIAVTENQLKAKIGKGVIDGNKVILVKPQTYMNLSGESVGPLAAYYKVDPESEVIVISDDIELPPGYIRVRPKGSAGGHNGLKSIIQHLGTTEFIRVRMGVGMKPPKMDLADHVLGHFKEEDEPELKCAIDDADAAIKLIMSGEIDKAQNQYNKKVSKEKA